MKTFKKATDDIENNVRQHILEMGFDDHLEETKSKYLDKGKQTKFSWSALNKKAKKKLKSAYFDDCMSAEKVDGLLHKFKNCGILKKSIE